MEEQKLAQTKELIERIADYNGPFGEELPTEEQVSKIFELTGVNWTPEELQLNCYEYWSHNSLAETFCYCRLLETI